jgi:hypothetical protein
VLLAFGGGAYVGGWMIAHFGWREGRTGGKVADPQGMRSLIRAHLRGQALRAADLIASLGQSKRVRKTLDRMRREGQIARQGQRGRYTYTLRETS